MKILVLGVFPRGSRSDAEQSLDKINEAIKPINEELATTSIRYGSARQPTIDN
jgi:hypothetical protein